MPALPSANNLPGNGFPIRPDDLIFILLRHKWKLVASIFAGILLGIGLFLFETPTYVSDAKLMIRYVMETRSLGPVSGVRQIKDTDQGAQSVLNSELQIITSQDIYNDVAEAVGPKRLLADTGLTNPAAAAGLVFKGLTVQVPTRSDVMILNFRHRDPQVAQDVLRELIKAYLAKHGEVHRSSDSFEFLQSQTDAVRTRLTETENELRKLKTDAGIISLETAKVEAPARVSALRQAVDATRAEIAQEVAYLNSLNKPREERPIEQTNDVSNVSDNELVSIPLTTRAPAGTGTNLPSVVSDSNLDSATKREAAGRLNQQLFELVRKETEMLATYQETAKPVQQLRQQILDVKSQIAKLGLLAADLIIPSNSGSSAAVTSFAPIISRDPNRIVGLQARIKILEEQLSVAVQEAKRLESFEDAIRRLERRRELEENQYKYFYTGLEQAKIDNALDSGKVNNITIIQNPSAPHRSKDDHIKAIAALVVPSVLVLLYLGLVEIAFPSTYRRGRELEMNLKLPVLVTIPHFGVNGHSKLRRKAVKNGKTNSDVASTAEIAPWDPEDPMMEYYEALRDRVVMSYNGDLHKPKVIGLTSCNKGAGVTRVATGLAAALSRDVERRVLYIALERSKVMVSTFAKGRPAEYLPEGQTAQELALTSENDFVQQSLVSLSRIGRGATGASIVQSFCDLLPRLRNSDFDYIVFDLPPLTQTSGSLRLAAQMERTLLMVEADKSTRQRVDKAKALLQSSQTSLLTVLNKARTYGPQSLRDDI